MPSAAGERLQKVLARAGYGSRRACELLIEEGRVTVDGEAVTLGRRVDPNRERVEVDGVPVSASARKRSNSQAGIRRYASQKPASRCAMIRGGMTMIA